VDAGKVLIDQTLYWAVVNSLDEAKYLVGLFNSQSIYDVIVSFIPKGEFGPRHLHTLPFKVTPEYDPEDKQHQAVVETTTKLLAELTARTPELNAMGDKTTGLGMFDPSLPLASRRRKIRMFVSTLEAYPNYEKACRSLYGLEQSE